LREEFFLGTISLSWIQVGNFK